MVTKCKKVRCETCQYIFAGESITLKNGKLWKINSSMSCKARNVIHLIISTKCENFYVGQTENLRKRVTLHKEQRRHDQYRHLTVSKHLKTCNDGKYKIFPIYHCNDPSRLIRKSKGKEIIGILRPDLIST